MTLIFCVDDKNGLRFNGRRQSRDAEVSKRIIDIANEGVLKMASASAILFSSFPQNIVADDDCLKNAQSGDYCFCEDLRFLPDIKCVRRIVLFRWNRIYPGDVYLPEHIYKDGFALTAVLDFPGKSHRQITMEVYDRAN